MQKKIFQNIARFFTSEKPVFWFYIAIPIFVTAQQLIIANNEQDSGHFFYNNFRIFYYSFIHLLEYRDLYLYHADHYADLYKYSPSFAVFMAPFALIPLPFGLFLWCAINCGIVYYAVNNMAAFGTKSKVLILWFIAHELLTSIQNQQANALIVGLIIIAFNHWEKGKVHWASLLLIIGVFIKPFVLVVFLLWLVYEKKVQFIAFAAFWTIIIIALPLIYVSYDQFVFLYKSWFNLLATDHSESYGLSVMGFVKAVFNVDAKLLILAIGVVLLCLPMVRIRQYKELVFRQLILSSALVWMVIFNHRAESPTFIIAVCGVAIWYFVQPYSKVNLLLLIFCLYITELTCSEIFFPVMWRNSFIDPYEIKALPCIIIWLINIYNLLFKKIVPIESSN